MALLPIVKFPDPLLQERSEEVREFNDELKTFVQDMSDTMYAAPGVGLAAVQVGVLKRILVLDPHAGDADSHIEVYINPVILESRGEQVCEEGCLSLPDFSEEVKRKEWIRVRHHTLDGEVKEVELEGFHAVILQHELDHLDGILATDRISRIRRALYVRRRMKAAREEAQKQGRKEARV